MHERGVFVASIHWSVKLQGYGPHAKATQGAQLVSGLPNLAGFVMKGTDEAICDVESSDHLPEGKHDTQLRHP